MVDPLRYLSPPKYAKQLGVNSEKVLGWIRRGVLRAINVADRVGGRPRWRISAEAIADFERRRSAVKPAKRRKQRKGKSEILDIIK